MIKKLLTYLLSVWLLSSPLIAQTTPYKKSHILSSRLKSRIKLSKEKIAVPGHNYQLHQIQSDWHPVTIRFDHVLTKDDIIALEETGLSFDFLDNKIVHVGTIYSGSATPETLYQLAEYSSVQRIESPPVMGSLPSFLTHNMEMVNAPQVWGALDNNQVPLTGEGTTIVDIDGSIDVFHPSFFKADGGLVPWLDVNDNGILDPGTDAIDLDRNNRATADEILRFIDGAVHYRNSYFNAETYFNDNFYQTDLDWLYLDSNTNGERDFGPDEGFTEQDPSYGEPLFIADDINQNGEVDLGEKLLALKTSKIVSYYSLGLDRILRRGLNIIQTPRPQEPSHGTGVVGILVGNEYGHHAFTGIAPSADIIFMDQNIDQDEGRSRIVRGMSWALDQNASVMIHEYGWPILEFNDGSSNLEQMIDESSAQGLTQCTATHNFGGKYPMHSIAEADPDEVISFSISFESFFGYETSLFYATLRWIGEEENALITIETPDGQELEYSPGGGWETTDNGVLFVSTGKDHSDRGTSMANLYLYREDMSALPDGRYKINVTNTSSETQIFDLFIADQSGYVATVALNNYLTGAGTAAWPSTADSAISVGAFMGNFELYEDNANEGDLRDYSGRGPRIDGEGVVDITAPDDSVTAMYVDGSFYGNFETFSGTSGALPIVGGTVALLLQAEPELTPSEVKDRLKSNALHDNQTGTVPNHDWGNGKISAYHAIFQEDPIPNSPPVAIISKEDFYYLGEVTLSADESTDAETETDELEVRWDFDYDGQWDTEFATTKTFGTDDHPISETGMYWILLEVRDPSGLTARALTEIEVREPQPEIAEEVSLEDVTADDLSPETEVEPTDKNKDSCACNFYDPDSGIRHN